MKPLGARLFCYLQEKQLEPYNLNVSLSCSFDSNIVDFDHFTSFVLNTVDKHFGMTYTVERYDQEYNKTLRPTMVFTLYINWEKVFVIVKVKVRHFG